MIWKEKPCTMIEFQSAHPVRGATFFGFRILPAPLFQSTRPVWGATVRRGDRGDGHPISIHAPRVGRDVISRKSRPQESRFQSTRPVWGATIGRFKDVIKVRHFNPRAPCGARHNRTVVRRVPEYFNPRAPCGARPCLLDTCAQHSGYFNPRAPCGARQSYCRYTQPA